MVYKIIQRLNKFGSKVSIFSTICYHCAAPCAAQSAVPDTLHVVRTLAEYRKTVRADNLQKMTDLRKRVPGILLDLRYTTRDNFMKRALYPPTRTTYLRWPVVRALAAVQKELRRRGLGLKIFDAYRPYRVTEKMWELVHDPRYVANPANGSGHNRGIAVDLTLVDGRTGKELEMPTGFDDFSDSAHQDFIDLPEKVVQNRQMLKEVMEKHGFRSFATEWWHYSWLDWKSFALMDLDFAELAE